MMDKFDLTRLIPMDELHWCDEEKKMVLLSGEQIESLLIAMHHGGTDLSEEDELNDAMKVIRWAEEILAGQKMLEGVFSGRLGIFYTEGMTEPKLIPLEELEEKNE